MKAFEQFRFRRRELYERLFSSRALCIAGLLIMPALLFNPNTLFRILQFLCFWFLAWLSGKKNNPLITILIMAFIIAFNLIVPYGRVLASIGPFRITAGALLAGIQRAVTLEALIMLSRFTIRRDLKIPGRFGELIGESFRIFAIIMDRKKVITRKNLMGDIDRLMLELSEDIPSDILSAGSAAAGAAAGKRTGAAGFIILAVIVLLAWSPWALMLFVPR